MSSTEHRHSMMRKATVARRGIVVVAVADPAAYRPDNKDIAQQHGRAFKRLHRAACAAARARLTAGGRCFTALQSDVGPGWVVCRSGPADPTARRPASKCVPFVA